MNPSATQPTLLERPAFQRGLALLFVPLILIISWLALSPKPPQQMSLGWDKLNHLCAFGSLCLLGSLAWPRRQFALLLALLAYGGAIELLQTLVPGRSGEWPDLLADALGLLLGSLATWALRRLLRPSPSKAN